MTRWPNGGRGRWDEAGGVWIRTGVVLGALVYLGVLAMAVAGFTAAVPLVVLPPVLVGLVAAASLLGGRTHGPGTGGPAGGRVPDGSTEPDGPGTAG